MSAADETLWDAVQTLKSAGWVTVVDALLTVAQGRPDLAKCTVSEVWDRYLTGVPEPVRVAGVLGNEEVTMSMVRAEDVRAAHRLATDLEGRH